MSPEWIWAIAALALAIVLRVVWSGVKLMLKLAVLVAIAGLFAAVYFGYFAGRT